MRVQRIRMGNQDPAVRIRNFDEVALGLTEEEAIAEAKRCLHCKKQPCVSGCPVEIDIPAFIELIANGDFKGAIAKLREKNSLPAVCGRVCPQEDQCERVCVLVKKGEAEGIGNLERFAADWALEHNVTHEIQEAKERQASSVKIAVIGSGPSGITCAGDLAKLGYRVTMFEALHKTGGVLVYGIPDFRLPARIVDSELDYVASLGVSIETNALIGRTKTFDDLKEEGFAAYFIGTGAGLPYFMRIEGENLNGVYSANEFLTRINLMKSYLFPEYDTPVKVGKKVAVIGAGNVAMDAARSAKRMGAEDVFIIYRRTEAEMPARIEEIRHAKEEGIRFELLSSPLRYLGDEDGWLKKAECIKNRLGEPDVSGRRRPVPVEGSKYMIELDTVVCAIGQGPNPLLLSTLPGLKLNKKGTIMIDKQFMTSIPGVFAGGDIVTGAATVIEAMGNGKKAARAIDEYLNEQRG